VLLAGLLFLCCGLRVLDANCDSEIYCQGPILERVQLSGLFMDSKQFVDMPTSKPKATVWARRRIGQCLLYLLA
jgi:alpha,alpha-trehalase